LSDDKLAGDVRTDAQNLLDRAEDRLGLGEDFTVVAFAGSTGSGKSSLFNAVAGLEIARVGGSPTDDLTTDRVCLGRGRK
jgi:predicted GTPase